MSSYIVLLLGLFILWIIAVWSNGLEIGAPASIVCFMFVAASALCILGYGAWNTVTLSPLTISIIWCGCATFLLGGAIAYHTRSRGNIRFDSLKQELVKRKFSFQVNTWWLILMMIALGVIAVVRVTSMKRMAINAGANVSGLIETSQWYRNTFNRLFSAGTVRVGVGETFYEKQILRFSTVITNVSVVCLLIGISQGNRRTVFVSGILVIMCCIYSLLTDGGRGGILFRMVTIAYGLYILQIRKGTKIRTINWIFCLLSIITLAEVLPLFYYSAALVGRKSSETLLRYLSFYFGCGIPSMEVKLQLGIPDYSFGQNVFYGFYTLLYKLGITEELNGYANEWLILGGHKSNIYTAWYRYYADFGALGVVVLPALYGWLFTKIYQKVKKSESLLFWGLFCAWSYSLFDLSRDDYFYGQFLATAPLINNALSIFVLMVICQPARADIYFQTTESQKAFRLEKNGRKWKDTFSQIVQHQVISFR